MSSNVIPAKAGIHEFITLKQYFSRNSNSWTPVFTGVTKEGTTVKNDLVMLSVF